jgi:hypothetical protein
MLSYEGQRQRQHNSGQFVRYRASGVVVRIRVRVRRADVEHRIADGDA